ncbi:condensation complex subunit 1 domain-containing protein [Striga asiatica]|uniref:Condensation complex subunit 1 domain-containing protein n=1 Tax=Striga asiatica TaxID=4170 RepID=A0A5A7R7D5_STRAF|nr:condensation complex subunit 1 domain-containing protein [Striga asiatica]
MDEIAARIISNLETQSPISESFLKDLGTLLDYTLKTNDPIDLENLYSELSARNLSLSSLANEVSSAMDTGLSSSISILSSKVYLSLLLSPNSPVFTLFTPMAFLSLLRAIRLAIKKPSLVSSEGSVIRSLGQKKKGKRNNLGNKKGSGNRKIAERSAEEGDFDVRDLFTLLEKLVKVMDLVHLDRFPDCLKALVQTACEIPMTAVENWGNLGSFKRLCELSSEVLSEALKAEHGIQGETAAEVLKALAPLILSSKTQVRSFALCFVVIKMIKMGENSDGIKKAVANMPKYLVTKSPERAEPRALAVESIIEIVKALDSEHQVKFADYLVKMSQGKGQLRLLSVDLIPVLIMSVKGPFGFDSAEGEGDSWGLRLLETLIQRCSDLTAAIRARALATLAQVVVSLLGDDKNRVLLKEVMGFGHERVGGVNRILKLRCMDEKAAVRKAALVLISKLIALLGGEVDEELLKTVGMACSDPLVSIRKVAILAMSEAFRTYSNRFVTKEWVHSIPRLISDNETSIQEECENLFLELVLDRISRAGSNFSAEHDTVARETKGEKHSSSVDDSESLYPEGVLILLKEVCDAEVSPWVRKICLSLGKKKKLHKKIATALQNIIKKSESQWLSRSMPIQKWTAPPGAWFLLSEVSSFLSKSIEWEFLKHHWQLVDKFKPVSEVQSPCAQGYEDDVEMVDVESSSVDWVKDRVYLLQTISNVSMELPPEPAADLAQNFLKRLERFNMHSTELWLLTKVNAHVKALRTLCKRKALNQAEADYIVTRWVDQLQSKASKVLDSYMSKISDSNKENAFLTPHNTGSRKAPRKADSKLLAKAVIAIYTIGSLVIVCPSSNLKTIVPAIHTIITSRSSDAKSSNLTGLVVDIMQIAPSLYIQAWLTMGKICLADGKLAKRYLPLFVQELEKSDCAALRNNIVVMMADFCVRYTAMVDCYMSKITKCLRDPCELVRRQTFILLSRLLQRDYVKWRGVLFLRFLLCLVDESEKIRQLADFLFGNILKAKAPLLAYNSFVESIFVLNDCNAHTGRSNSNSARNENHLFSIRGNDEKSRLQRMHIYTTLLKQMATEHLLATFAKVCAEILAAASDGMLSIDDITGQAVVQDAFLVLSSKEIRIQSGHGPSSSSSSSEAADVEDECPESNPRGSRAITQAVRKSLVQNAIPIFIELKRLLESKNSPLTGSLMDCLRALLKDYKNEIDEMLVADRQLQKELVYDMQKYESNRGKCAQGDCGVTVRSVLREVNGTPLGGMSVPKLKTRTGGDGSGGGRVAAAPEVMESGKLVFEEIC